MSIIDPLPTANITPSTSGTTFTFGPSYTYSTTPSTHTSSPVVTTGTYAYDTNWLSNTILGNYGSTNNDLNVSGDANFSGDVKIKGKSILDSLEKIEEKLAILRPNEQLEEKWEKLRDLRRQYMELEKEITEKEQIWEILKK